MYYKFKDVVVVEEAKTKNDIRKVHTTCPYCGVGCQIEIYFSSDRLFKVEAFDEVPPNYGALCVKGKNGLGFIESDRRITQPLIRRKKDRDLEPVNWDVALDFMVRRLADIIKRYGPDSTGFFSSAKATNEENYLMQKIARSVVGTNNVDHCARLCHSTSGVAMGRSVGAGAMTNTIEEIQANDVMLIVGSNILDTYPIIGIQMKKAVQNGARLIVVDPRNTAIARYAELHLGLRPGSDTVLFNGIGRYIVDAGLQNNTFIEKNVKGFDEWLKSVELYTLEYTEKITGISAEDVRKAAEMYARAERGAIYWAMGATQHAGGTDNVQSLVNLALITGKLGKRGTGLNPIRGQNNVQGAGDMGALPNVFPGGGNVTDSNVRRYYEGLWGVERLPENIGLGLTDIIEGTRVGRIKAIYLMGEDPMTSEPYQDHVTDALNTLELFVVQDILLNETTSYADVVLPAACFAEKDGTFINTDRRVQRIRKAVEPPGEARPDWKILSEVGRRLSVKLNKQQKWDYNSPEEVWNEVRNASPSLFKGISYARIESKGVRWPCPSEEHPGTEDLFVEGFNTPSKKAQLFPAEYSPPVEIPDEKYPLVLNTGRVLFHWHGGTMSRRSKLAELYPELLVEVNPNDAERYGIRDKDYINVVSRRGQITARAKVTDRSPEGVVFVPIHFVEAPANRLTLNVYDHKARIPEYKNSAVRIMLSRDAVAKKKESF